MTAHDRANSPDRASTGPVGGLPSSDDLYQIVAELLALAADRNRLARRYARLAHRIDLLAEAQGWPGQPQIPAEAAGPAARVAPDPSRMVVPIALPRRMRLASDPGS